MNSQQYSPEQYKTLLNLYTKTRTYALISNIYFVAIGAILIGLFLREAPIVQLVLYVISFVCAVVSLVYFLLCQFTMRKIEQYGIEQPLARKGIIVGGSIKLYREADKQLRQFKEANTSGEFGPSITVGMPRNGSSNNSQLPLQ